MPGSPEDRPISGASGPLSPAPRGGGGPGTALRLDARLDACAQVRAFVRARAADLGADETATTDLVQAVDEWVTNVVVHGYRGSPGPVDIEVERDAASIVVRVIDRAPVFDPGVAPRFRDRGAATRAAPRRELRQNASGRRPCPAGMENNR